MPNRGRAPVVVVAPLRTAKVFGIASGFMGVVVLGATASIGLGTETPQPTRT